MIVSKTKTTYQFIAPKDELSALLNQKSNELFYNLRQLDVDTLELDEFGRYYFLKHHIGSRLFFSLESSAAIIYHSVKKTGKDISSLCFMDYGAGMGTLFLLAAMVGFKSVLYNDHLESWGQNARAVCKRLNLPIDAFIIGDIDTVIAYKEEKGVSPDIIASRNVVEHIYDLSDFFSKSVQHFPGSIIYSTTTANYHNIAMRIKHHLYHRKVERNSYREQRRQYIKEMWPDTTEADLRQLVKITRGRAFTDFTNAVQLYFNKATIPVIPYLSTNTCDCSNGVWAENIIPRKAYSLIVEKAGLRLEYTPGFWDTNYGNKAINILTRCFNVMVRILGRKGYWLSPFVNIIAYSR